MTIPDCPFKVQHDLVLVEQVARTDAPTIHLPDGSKTERTHDYVVIGVGPGRRNEQGNVMEANARVGDRVIINVGACYGFKHADFEDRAFIVVRPTEILLVFKEEVPILKAPATVGQS
jgi:co-chaperonin GroES (HSP10)